MEMNATTMREQMQRLGISEATMASMKQFLLETSVPRLLEKKRQATLKEETKCL